MTAEPLTAAEQERVARFDAAAPAEESFENVARVMQAIWEAADGYMSGVPWERARLNAFREAKVFRQATAAITALRPAPDTAKTDDAGDVIRALADDMLAAFPPDLWDAVDAIYDWLTAQAAALDDAS